MPAATSHDAYLAEMTPDQRDLLNIFRAQLSALLPGADEVIAYAMPGYQLDGKVVAGYAGWAKHCSFYPHSGHIVPLFLDEITALGLSHTQSAVHFTADNPIPENLLVRMLAARRAEITKS